MADPETDHCQFLFFILFKEKDLDILFFIRPADFSVKLSVFPEQNIIVAETIITAHRAVIQQRNLSEKQIFANGRTHRMR